MNGLLAPRPVVLHIHPTFSDPSTPFVDTPDPPKLWSLGGLLRFGPYLRALSPKRSTSTSAEPGRAGSNIWQVGSETTFQSAFRHSYAASASRPARRPW